MEKNREGRRGGAIKNRHVSATRRSRASVPKYSSVSNEDGDDMVENEPSPNPKMHDRSKKHSGRISPLFQESDSCKDRGRSQHKRKCLGSQEPQNDESNVATAKVKSYNSDDAETARSEDDDDLPPPAVPCRPWRLKLHTKVREDLTPIDPAAVPRKLRTAMTKRQQESTLHMHVADVASQHASNDVAPTSAPTCSNMSVNPGRKKKPVNQKHSTSKLVKASSTRVSKTEVEVAETLFDLARMFTAHSMPSAAEAKPEPKLAVNSTLANSATSLDLKPSPEASAVDAASPSSTVALSQPGAMKQKRQRMSSKIKDEGTTPISDPCWSPELAVAEQAHCFHSDKGQSDIESKLSPQGVTLVPAVIGLMAVSPDIKADLENPVTAEEKELRMDTSISASEDVKSTYDPQENLTVANFDGPMHVDSELTKNPVMEEAIHEEEHKRRPLILTAMDCGDRNKIDIDLMSPPEDIGKADCTLDSNMPDAKEKEKTLPNSDKADDIMDFNVADAKETDKMDLETVLAAEVASVGERKKVEISKDMEFEEENKQLIQNTEHDECNRWTPEKDNSIFREKNKKTEPLKDKGKQETAKPAVKGTGKIVKGDLCIQRIDRPDSNVPTKATTRSNPPSIQLPVSMGMSGWPGGFPHLSYYSPAAAAAAAAVAASWLTPVSMTGMSSTENSTEALQLPSFLFPTHQSRKRCATHVYITHFIDCQRQMKSNPLWAASYGSSTGLYGNGLIGTSASTTLAPGGRSHDLPWTCLKDKGNADVNSIPVNVNGAKNREGNACMDVLEIKSNSQQQTQPSQKKSPIFQNGSIFSLPFTGATSLSGSSAGAGNTTEGNVLVTAAMFSTGSNTSTCTSSVSGAGNSLLDGSVANAAVLQAQLLNSVIQQPTFPFSISPALFGTTYSGPLVPQQLPHIYNHPFYEPHMMSQQLANPTSVTTGQKQPKSSQGLGSFPPSESSQLQHQHAISSSQAGVVSQNANHMNEKNIPADNRSAAKVQLPMVQRNAYGQNFPSGQVSSLNSQSTEVASCTPTLPVHSQDFSLMTTFGVKQVGKMKQQAEAHLPFQQQNAYLSTQNHATVPGLQTQSKGFDSKSQPSSMNNKINRGPISPDLRLPSVASITASQGQTAQSMVDLARGQSPSQKSTQNQPISGQAHQYSIPASHNQQKQQQQLRERVVTTAVVDAGITTNDRSYGNGGHEENQKTSVQRNLDKSNVLRCEWETSKILQGSQTNAEAKIVNNATANMIAFSEGSVTKAATFGKLPTEQGIHFPGQDACVVISQALRCGHTTQDLPQLKATTIASAVPILPDIYSNSPQALQRGLSQGQQSRGEQPTLNSGQMQRILPGPSIPSAAATATMLCVPPVSKSGVGAVNKNSLSRKDSHLSQQKLSVVSTSVKASSAATAANMVSILGSGPSATALQGQLNQNHYNIQQHQQHQNLRHQQSVQLIDPAQKHHGQSILQNYPLNHNYSHQILKQPSPQQQHRQVGQQLLIHQPLQYEVRTQSQVHSQPIHQQPTTNHQQTSQHLQQPLRQIVPLPQQLGSIQQQHLKQVQPAIPASFGVTVTGNLSHNLGSVNAGHASFSVVSSRVTTPAKSTGEIITPCPDSKVNFSDGPILPHSRNDATSTLQHISNTNTVSLPYLSSISQSMHNSGAVEKLNEKINQ